MTNQFGIAATVLLMIASTDLARGSGPSQHIAICIEHAGESNKPVHGISISESDLGIESCRKDSQERVGLANLWEHVVDSKLALRLMAIVDGTASDESEHPHEFGTLLVVIVKGNDKHVLVLNRAHGVMLLGELQRSCADRTLQSHLAHLQGRITE